MRSISGGGLGVAVPPPGSPRPTVLGSPVPPPGGGEISDEAAQRAAVVAEARSWLGTPYAHAQGLKRAGVDCGTLLVRCFVDSGIVEPFDPRPYSRTWFLHRDEEKYLDHIFARGGEIAEPPRSGDIVMWRIGRLYAHGAIVSKWPRVIHAYAPARMVIETDLSLPGVCSDEREHPKRFFSVWKHDERASAKREQI